MHPPGARTAADLGGGGLVDAQVGVVGGVQRRQRPWSGAFDHVLSAHLPQGGQGPDGGLDIGGGTGLRVVPEGQRGIRPRFHPCHIANDLIPQPGRRVVEAVGLRDQGRLGSPVRRVVSAHLHRPLAVALAFTCVVQHLVAGHAFQSQIAQGAVVRVQRLVQDGEA